MDGRNLRSSNRRLAIPIFGLLIALAGAACSGGAGGGGGSSASTITLAAVDNPSMADLKKLVPDFNSSSVNGICLRGLPGWGEQLAPLDTVVNTYGGRWFDQNWNAQLTTQPWHDAVTFYVNLLKSAGEPGAGNAGFTECLNAYNSGKVAMWYDATVAASFFTGDAAKNSGYAYAPTKVKDCSGWLLAWSLGMPSTITKKDSAWTFANWATNKDYAKLVGSKLGWARVSPGTRTSTYSIPEYKAAAGAFAQVTLDSIAHADVSHPTVDPVPYVGVQYVDIDEFQQLGDQVSQEFAKVIAGGQTVDQALQKAQALAAAVGKNYQH